jgi:hypothetical protein
MALPPDLIRQIKQYYDGFGDRLYDRNRDVLPGVVEVIDRYPFRDIREDLIRASANSVLDDIEAAEDQADKGKGGHRDLFNYDARVALGEKQRIKRSKMTFNHHLRRALVVDRNKEAQDVAWANEKRWLNLGIDALRGYSPTTPRDAVLTSVGTKI